MNGERLRVDKWLWYARCAKTRTAAQRLLLAGRIRINREKNDNPAYPIKIGDVLTVTLESGVRVLKVAALGERRGPPATARLLYEDLSPPPTPGPATSDRVGGRPTKRDRRAIEAFRQSPPDSGASDEDD